TARRNPEGQDLDDVQLALAATLGRVTMGGIGRNGDEHHATAAQGRDVRALGTSVDPRHGNARRPGLIARPRVPVLGVPRVAEVFPVVFGLVGAVLRQPLPAADAARLDLAVVDEERLTDRRGIDGVVVAQDRYRRAAVVDLRVIAADD